MARTFSADFPVEETDGGTGQTSFTKGDILYSSETDTLSKLAIGSDGEVLKIASGIPEWSAETDTDEKVSIDSSATAGYIGATSNDGVIRSSSPLTYTDGGDYITLAITQADTDNDGYISSTDWDTFNAKQSALGYTPEDVVNKSNDITTDASSTTKYPSVKAFKDYSDSLVTGLLDYRGGYDASGNTYPVAGGSGTAGAVLKGDMWVISVAGTLGGEAVQVGDSIIANIDTPAQTASNWNHLNANISYVPENVANRLAAFQGTPDDSHYISEKLAYDQLALKANLISPSFTTPNIGAATGTSLALEGTTLGILNLKNTDASSYTRMLFDGTGVDFTTGVGNASASITDLRNKYYVYDLTNGKTAFTIVPDTLAAKFYGALEVVGSITGTTTGNLVSGGALGTPSSGTLTNCTFPTLNQNTTGSSGSCTGNSATVTGFTPASGSLTLSGADALTLTTSAETNVTLPTSGTLATTSQLHDAVTIGTANGLSLSTQELSLALASTSTTGALSSTNWNTFNGKMSNPMTTAGDIIYGGTGGAPTRLEKGTDGKVLTLVSGIPSWEDAGTANALPLAGGTMTGGIVLATGSTTIAPIKMVAGTNLTTPISGVMKWDGTNLYFTV